MKLEFAFICDYASQNGGKIDALGIGFDVIWAPRLPFLIPHFHLVAKFNANKYESGTKRLKIVLMDPDGKDIIPPIEGSFEIVTPPQESESHGIIAIGFHGVQFQKYGSHSLHLIVEGNEMVSIPMALAAPPSTM